MLTYSTVSQSYSVELPKIKGSRFIGHIFPVSTPEQAQGYIDQMRKQHYAATHNCYLWRCGIQVHRDLFGQYLIEHRYYKASDDGEPGSTATNPMKKIIVDGYQLYNVLMIVTRYFGGTKLGIGGLISAYGDATKAVLKTATIVHQPVEEAIEITYDYQHEPLIAHLQRKYQTTIKDSEYRERVRLVLGVNVTMKESLMEKLETLQHQGLLEMKLL